MSDRTKSYYAHKLILAMGSKYFERLLEGGFKEGRANEIQITDKISTFDNILKVLYGVGVEIDATAKGLRFLEAMDYYMINGPSQLDYIEAMDVPKTPDLVIFITELRKMYPQKLPKKIVYYLDDMLEDIDNNEKDPITVVKSFWHLLPKSFTKSREHHLEAVDEARDNGED